MFGDSDDSEDEQDIQRPERNGVMQFHNGTEEAMLLFVQNKLLLNDALSVSIEAITTAIDEYCTMRHWMMHIGPSKSAYLLDAMHSMQKWGDVQYVDMLNTLLCVICVLCRGASHSVCSHLVTI